jgi:hypothetical protein
MAELLFDTFKEGRCKHVGKRLSEVQTSLENKEKNYLGRMLESQRTTADGDNIQVLSSSEQLSLKEVKRLNALLEDMQASLVRKKSENKDVCSMAKLLASVYYNVKKERKKERNGHFASAAVELKKIRDLIELFKNVSE